MVYNIIEIDVIISNKNHPASISLLLSRVGASVDPSQDNLNVLLCLHWNTSSLHSFNSSPAIFKIDYTNFFIDTQVTSTIEAIRGWRLPDHFPRYLRA